MHITMKHKFDIGTDVVPEGYEQIVSEDITIEFCLNEHDADVKCSRCGYMGEVEVLNKDWKVYRNPNYDYIKISKLRYLKFLDLCPEAIEFVTNEVDYICCPACSWCRLKVARNSRYSLELIKLSLNCNVKL